ncbi:hypothetical protein JA9_000250 [Meyerozyma sp. JA9]|nr:hypothetical protein JA9_000250 [Meyerozyma sp. JA9]
MYSPSVVTTDLYSLWRTPDAGVGDRNGTAGDEEHRSGHNNRSLYAPPLSAYSAEYPGASLYQLEYTISTQEGTRGANLPPQTHRKLERIQRIRNTGYTSLIPIGMKKTMRQLDAERAHNAGIDEDDEPEITHMAENVPGERVGRPNGAAEGGDSEVNNTDSNIVSNSNSNMMSRSNDMGSSIDLDAAVPNMDELNSSNGTFVTEDDEIDNDEEPIAPHLGDLLNEDEGFMADEVEYQEDHSFASEIGIVQPQMAEEE